MAKTFETVYATSMTITASLFESFLKCPTKCWLRAAGEAPSGNTYAAWVTAQNESYRATETERLLAATLPGESDRSPLAEDCKTAKWRLAMEVTARTPEQPCRSRREEANSSLPKPSALNQQPSTNNEPTSQSLVTSAPTGQPTVPPSVFVAETHLHAVERVPSEGRGKAAQFIPIRFIFRNKLTRDDKLLLAFDAFVLSAALGREITVGKIIHGDEHTTLKVKTSAVATDVRKRLEKTAALLCSPTPPDLILNRHCAECEFQARCRQKAIEKDDLSLLAGMSEKERRKFHSKGIFTITQLSYTFRPRRRPKKMRDKREKYHHSLKALAIREKKIHIVGSPELKIEGTPVYLDVEGVPDRDFYYLIGLRIGNGESAVQHSLWADTVEDEGKIWREFLGILETVEKPVLIHYGSYETKFSGSMCERYGGPPEGSVAAKAIQTAVNLLSVIFGQIYFPTISNGLKEIATYIGFVWQEQIRVGLASIVARNDWEWTLNAEKKAVLIAYNRTDCEALDLMSSIIRRLGDQGHKNTEPKQGNLETVQVFGLRDERRKWTVFKSSVPELETITTAAHWDYQRDRIRLKSDHALRRVKQKPKHNRGNMWRVDKVVLPPTNPKCPLCDSAAIKKGNIKIRTFQDIVFARHSIKRKVFECRFQPAWCPKCHFDFGGLGRTERREKYSRGFLAYVFWQIIELNIPQMVVAKSFNRIFGFNLTVPFLAYFKERFASYYVETRDAILKRMISGRLLHVDETSFKIRGKGAYVWVFANHREVVYLCCESREGTLVHDMLADFRGVLVSDFYSVYDSLDCPQQKCLIHLIRDLNNELLAHPYDEELKRIVKGFAEHTKPIIETVDKHGLRKHYLLKYQKSVDRFYKTYIEVECNTEPALACQDRFRRNRDKLYTFLHYDAVPWNNNNAEHAVKAFARLREVIEGSSTRKGLDEYLILLSVCQTCKYMGVDFLDFLRSGEKDIHAFAESRRGRSNRSAMSETQRAPA